LCVLEVAGCLLDEVFDRDPYRPRIVARGASVSVVGSDLAFGRCYAPPFGDLAIQFDLNIHAVVEHLRQTLRRIDDIKGFHLDIERQRPRLPVDFGIQFALEVRTGLSRFRDLRNPQTTSTPLPKKTTDKGFRVDVEDGAIYFMAAVSF
jgi:hypothetical protein